MRRVLRRRWAESLGSGVDERLDQVSADLPYELQSKMFDQLAAVSIAGAGLSVTLIGSILRDAPPIVWLAVIEFGLAAIVAISANNQLITGLFRREAILKRSRINVGIAAGLIGLAMGSLSMSIYYDGKAERPAAGAEQSRAGQTESLREGAK